MLEHIDPICKVEYDGVERVGSSGAGVIRCTLPAEHEGNHEDAAFDAPSIVSWPVEWSPVMDFNEALGVPEARA